MVDRPASSHQTAHPPSCLLLPLLSARTWGSALAAGPMAWNPLKARAPPREPPPPYSIGAVPAGYNPTAPASPANNGGGGATATAIATSTGGGTTQASAAAGNNGSNSPQIVWGACVVASACACVCGLNSMVIFSFSCCCFCFKKEMVPDVICRCRRQWGAGPSHRIGEGS